jgi:hypothetical protein
MYRTVLTRVFEKQTAYFYPGFETCMHFWMRCCLREIPPYTLVELTRLMQLSGGRESTLVQQAADWKTALESNLHWMYWKQVYAEYWRYDITKVFENIVKQIMVDHFLMFIQLSIVTQCRLPFSGAVYRIVVKIT